MFDLFQFLIYTTLRKMYLIPSISQLCYLTMAEYVFCLELHELSTARDTLYLTSLTEETLPF